MEPSDSFILPKYMLQDYFSLEKKFLEITKFIPIHKNHYSVFSLEYANLLAIIGNILDSAMRNMIFNDSMNDVQGIEKHRTQKRPLNIVNFREVYGKGLNLKDKTIWNITYIVGSEQLPNNRVIPLYENHVPFEDWKRNNSPTWWQIYNKIKHERFKNFREATMRITLTALAGLFLLLCACIPTRMELIESDKVICHNRVKDEMKRSLKVREPINRGVTIKSAIVKTELFGYIYEFTESFYPDQQNEQINAGILFGTDYYLKNLRTI